ncbi:MAG TPA: hypothetical protein VI933_01090 [archaeon]|nr:hypothetical protein [archaeon]
MRRRHYAREPRKVWVADVRPDMVDKFIGNLQKRNPGEVYETGAPAMNLLFEGVYRVASRR